MKKTVGTRLLAMLLCVAMLATVTPIFAAAETVITAIHITDADITPIIGDEAGDHLSYTLPDDCHFTVGLHYWYMEGVGSITNPTVFAEGFEYDTTFELYPEDGYVFADDLTITINGTDTVIDWENTIINNDYCYVWTKPADAGIEITEVTITNADITPILGEKKNDHLAYTLPEGAPYYKYNSGQNRWFASPSESGDTFVEGVTYSRYISLEAADGYLFDENTVITVNGTLFEGEFNVYRFLYDGGKYLTILMPGVTLSAEEQITEIHITDADITAVIGEKAGNHLDYTLPDDCHFTVDDHFWYNDTNDGRLSADDTFKADIRYDVGWWLKADEGYVFAKNPTITINGETDIVDPNFTKIDDEDNTHFYVWTKVAEAEVASKEIDKVSYKANLYYDDYFYLMDYKREFTLYAGTTEITDDIVWTDIVEIRRTDDPSKPLDEWIDLFNEDVNSFEKGYAYKVLMAATLSEPYTFAEGLSVEDSEGNPADFEFGDNNITQVLIWMDVALSDPPASKPLTVSVKMNSVPYGGDTIGTVGNDFTMTYDADEADVTNYAYSYCMVSDDPLAPEDEWEFCDDSDKFETGRSYAFRYFIGLNPDKYNDKTVLDTATLTINGKEPDKVEVDWDGNTYIGIYVVFPNIEGIPEMPYNLIVGDKIVTSDNAADIFGDGTASYDAESNTLTLDNADITTDYEWHTIAHNYASIFANGDLNLVVKGDNKITSEAAETGFVDSIHVNGNLTVSGDGDLTVSGGDTAIFCENDVKIFAEGAYSFEGNTFGAMVNGETQMLPNTPGATVRFKGTEKSKICDSFDYYDFDLTGNDVDETYTALENTDYDLYVGGVEVTAANKDDILNDGKVSYDPETKTLTLNGATIDTLNDDLYGGDSLIYSGKPLTICLVGDNLFEMKGVDTWAAAVLCNWDLTVTGEGSLNIKNDNPCYDISQNGLWTYYNLTVDIGGAFNVTYGDSDADVYVLYSSEGDIYFAAGETNIQIGKCQSAEVFESDNNLTIENAGDFTLTVGDTSDRSLYLLEADSGKVFVSNTGKMTLTSGNAQSYNYGILAYKDVILLNDGSFTLNVGNATDCGANGIESFCNVNVVSDGDFTVTVGESQSYGSCAVFASEDASFVCSGKVTLTSSDAYDNSSVLTGCDTVIIGGDAEYTLASGNSFDSYTEAICGSTIHIEGDAKVDAFCGNGGDSSAYGFDAEFIEIVDNASVELVVNGAKSYAQGIEGYVDVLISTSGTVTVTVGAASDESYGILSSGNITISGSGSVSACAGEAAASEGFHADGKIFIGGTAKENYIQADGKTAAFNVLPAFEPKAYLLTGMFEGETEMKDITVDDMMNCVGVVMTATEDAPLPSDKLLGDANDDGNVNMKDVLLARKHLAGIEVTINLDNADCNCDGSVNMKDVLMLRKYLANIIESLQPIS